VRRRVAASLLALLTGLGGCSTGSDSDRGPSSDHLRSRVNGGGSQAAIAASPYLYLGGPGTPNPVSVMARTGVRGFTFGFVLSGDGCRPVWVGQDDLGGRAAGQVARVQRAGAEVTVSVGGALGRKLGATCPNARALAGAYQQVIDTHDVAALDIDVEGVELENPQIQDRILGALKIAEQRNAALTTMVTLPVAEQGLDSSGLRMVRRAAELDVPVDIWTILPFNFGGGAGNMGTRAIKSARHTHRQLEAAYRAKSDAEVYDMQGISLMNGRTDTGELMSIRDFRQVRAFAWRHDLARFSFWSVNRDRKCTPARTGTSTCSGIAQRPLQFTEIVQGWGAGPAPR
jgi:chitinase